MANEERLINANAFAKCLERMTKTAHPDLLPGLLEAIEYAKDFPAVDAVEVVRCKDCFADGCCSVQIDLDMGGDGYCSKGKRRTDNG